MLKFKKIYICTKNKSQLDIAYTTKGCWINAIEWNLSVVSKEPYDDTKKYIDSNNNCFDISHLDKRIQFLFKRTVY